MNCLNCGCACENYLCANCISSKILDKIFNEIQYYKQETCENPYLAEYANRLTEKYEERNCIPEILDLFDSEISEYYYCLYFWMLGNPQFEKFEKYAIAYLDVHSFTEEKSQRITYKLLKRYHRRKDFIKPQKWYGLIAETDGLCAELYMIAAQFYSMIGEYDLSDQIADKALAYCESPDYNHFLFSDDKEKMVSNLNTQKNDTQRYRTKKPYWPKNNEEARRAVATFYDKKGIQHPRITNRPSKVKESDFAPIHECSEEEPQDFCAFWCEEAYSLSAAKSIYQIGAVRVRDCKVVEDFQSLIRPWDSGAISKKNAAKKAGVPLETIEAAEDVDLVIPKFFEFVSGDTLASTDALGNQGKLLSRAARYSGMTEIKNEFLDLLDVATNTNPDFGIVDREYLLDYFGIAEGKDALEKAEANAVLYQKLKAYGDANE